jgi:FkbM family methyltransferase
MQVAEVTIAGRTVPVAGHAEDSFFAYAAEHAAGLAPMRAVAAAATPADGVILDVGANIGLSALAFAGLVPAGRILAVEPSPQSVAALRETLRRNGLEGRVTVAPVALADAPGELAFHEAAHSAGAHLMDPNMLSGIGGRQVRVPVTTLDALLAEYAIPALHFVKIDVEGFESEVMAGATESFARHRPVVFAEYNAWVLQALRNANPRATLEAWMARFPVVHAMREGRPPWRITTENLLDFLHDHLVVRGCADDLVLSWDDAWLPRYQVPD